MNISLRNRPTALVALYWAATAVIFLVFMGSGIALLAGAPAMVAGMAHLGYPAYFIPLLGVWKVLGALAIAAPRLPLVKEWAYAGIMFDLTGAVTSRLEVGDTGMDAVLPALFIVAAVASWTLRPTDRRLVPAASVHRP
ncbi:DoxX family protein [Mesorhizobium sp. B1-1-8]|uniref:DoxX family protein n=1 Tax=Mesorhizobium sp. B1-1-8 TaxID=2589976 RepID=UPI00112699B9|nr:DoxX family protein [Mesorhizobium sp. B1-1-8]UCI07918.1 DoxX family protein [Mesorhizobium sp. B1-1-8]